MKTETKIKIENAGKILGLALACPYIPKAIIDIETDYMELKNQFAALGIQNDERLLNLKNYARKLSETTVLTYRQAFNYYYHKLRRAVMAGDFTPIAFNTDGLIKKINFYQEIGLTYQDAVFRAFQEEDIPYD